MLNKFLILTTLFYVNNANMYDDSNIQTFSIKYYNNTECNNYFSEMDIFTKDCYYSGNFDRCCNDLLDVHALRKNDQLDTCYLNNKTNMSYYYVCAISGYYYFNYVALWSLIFCMIALIGCLTCATGNIYYKKHRNEYTELNKV